MIQNLVEHLNQYASLTEEEIEYLHQHLPVRVFPKGEYLLRQGEISNAFFYIVEGCVRMYYEVGEEERTAFFYTETQFVSSYESFTRQIPSKHNLQSIEDTTIVIISHEEAHKILEQFPKFELLSRVLQEEELIIYQNIIATFITLSPEQRYLKLLEEQPDLFRRIPQHYLATYIGVKAESLSRIRKRISDKRIS
jgi:CRP-like cAMP-binding protein